MNRATAIRRTWHAVRVLKGKACLLSKAGCCGKSITLSPKEQQGNKGLSVFLFNAALKELLEFPLAKLKQKQTAAKKWLARGQSMCRKIHRRMQHGFSVPELEEGERSWEHGLNFNLSLNLTACKVTCLFLLCM
ncbi:hypothetical protein KIL84_015926 [Mauremys mutica]|uniref:Uncharacterized protein n=1 Tax=Mauremys mutica TaxID=74926 RepID=A0A9D4AQA6_9SAUR|nr:hypothetical protein KIL84_015926 [Mauremys mutica]